MPRKPRQIEIGKIYHVLSRGIEKRKIFLKNQDYSRFVFGLELFNDANASRLWEVVTKAGSVPALVLPQKPRQRIVELLAFALMPNHYHLILKEIQSGGISLFMKKMGGYSTYFNRQYNRVGPLFPRYKAVPIQDDVQLHTIFAYVHTNPVELIEPEWKNRKVQNITHAIEYAENYKWSSLHEYIDEPSFPNPTQLDFFMNFFGTKERCKEAIVDWIQYKAQSTNFGDEILE